MLKTDLWFEPREKAMRLLPIYPGEPEMTEFDSGFLCGLLREYKPKKLLEVGIAGGGTTAIILQCLSLMNQQVEMHSIDLSESFYLDSTKQSGFLAEEIKPQLDLDGITHKVHLGKLTANLVEEIGGGIDFVILDTTHAFPGELLDFLTLFPYLAKDAVVVLHDVIFSLVSRPDIMPPMLATKTLLDCVTADKYFMPDEISNRATTLPTIGAFRLNEATGKNIIDVFRAVAVLWSYSLEQWQVSAYRDIFAKHYDEECLWLYDSAVIANRFAVQLRSQIELASCLEQEKGAREEAAAQAAIAKDTSENVPLPFGKRIRRMARVILKGY